MDVKLITLIYTINRTNDSILYVQLFLVTNINDFQSLHIICLKFFLSCSIL